MYHLSFPLDKKILKINDLIFNFNQGLIQDDVFLTVFQRKIFEYDCSQVIDFQYENLFFLNKKVWLSIFLEETPFILITFQEYFSLNVSEFLSQNIIREIITSFCLDMKIEFLTSSCIRLVHPNISWNEICIFHDLKVNSIQLKLYF